jgi:hypothetical protein
MGAENH